MWRTLYLLTLQNRRITFLWCGFLISFGYSSVDLFGFWWAGVASLKDFYYFLMRRALLYKRPSLGKRADGNWSSIMVTMGREK